MNKSINSQSGQSLVELIIVIGLCAVLFPALITGLVASRSGKAQQKERVEAVTLLKEAEEAVRSIREKDWANLLPIGTELHTVRDGTGWKFVNTAEIINGFTRKVIISNIYRDASGNIILTGTPEQIDPSTKKVVISVAWSKPIPASVDSVLYLTRYLSNNHQTETTDTQFNNGTKTKVAITKTGDGEVVLGTGANGDWCQPNKLPVPEIDLPKNGKANAITAIVGRVFAGTGENSSGVSFANVNVDNSSPPVATIIGTADGYKTNGIFGESDYAYLATDTNSQEIIILDLAHIHSGIYDQIGYFNAPGNDDGISIYVYNNIGFMTSNNKLYTFNLSQKTGGRSQLNTSSVPTLSGTGNKIIVVGNYVYVAAGSTSNQLQIYQYSADGKTLALRGQLTVNGGAGRDIHVNSTGTRAYLATAASTSKNELFVINVQNPSSPSLVKSFDTNGMDPHGVTAVANDTISIIVGSNGLEYQVVRIPTDSSPMNLCGSWNINTGVNGVASVTEPDGDVFSYIITGDTAKELKLITGGGGSGGTYTSNGTFESETLDFSKDVVFNRFFVTEDKSTGTDIQYQVAAADAVSGSCTGANYIFVGPDGTVNTKFTGGGFIPWNNDGAGYENPARCFKYKAYLSTSDTSKTPRLLDFSVNYSP